MVPARGGRCGSFGGWQIDGAGQRIPDYPRKALPETIGDVLAGPGPEKRPGRGLEPLTDREHLLGGLALAEDHLGLPLP